MDLGCDREEDANKDRDGDEGHGEAVDGGEWPKRDLTAAKEERKREAEED